jgi:hypothetical protein
MENDYNDNENLINSLNEYRYKKYSSTIKFWYVLSIVICIISYILLDVDIITYHESLIEKNINIPSEYQYIYIYDILYGAWYLGIYIYAACKNYQDIKCLYCLIPIMYLANFILHILLYVDINNELKKNNMRMTKETDDFIFYCISVIFNWIMTIGYLKYI